ncbi:MAG: amidohydrolase [Pedosphaera sp.]|jgi:L-fuconolactonase|nr:amidohydrolase [Pedosphaera sp.]
MNRRQALTLAAAGLTGCVSPGRLTRGHIDAHSHIWTTEVDRFPLRKGVTIEDLAPRSFTAEDLIKLGHTEGVTRHVLISHRRYHGFNNDYYTHAVTAHPGVFAVVGALDRAAGRIAERMRANRLLGITGYRIKPEDNPRWLEVDTMKTMWRAGAEQRIAMCPLIRPEFIPSLDPMCRQFPETPVVIDHCARVDLGQDDRLQQLCALAKYPKVHVKVSAFYAFGAKKPPYDEQAPKVKALFEAFGPRRLMWASDCPYQLNDGNTYAASIAFVRDRLAFLNAEDKDWILRRTAEQVFFD